MKKILQKIKNLFKKDENVVVNKFLFSLIKASRKYGYDLQPVIMVYENNQPVIDEKKEKQIIEKINEFLNKRKWGLRPDIKIVKIKNDNASTS